MEVGPSACPPRFRRSWGGLLKLKGCRSPENYAGAAGVIEAAGCQIAGPNVISGSSRDRDPIAAVKVVSPEEADIVTGGSPEPHRQRSKCKKGMDVLNLHMTNKLLEAETASCGAVPRPNPKFLVRLGREQAESFVSKRDHRRFRILSVARVKLPRR